jgi:radical SAM superfamily enzyme YgiQ (UPF0313 family)
MAMDNDTYKKIARRIAKSTFAIGVYRPPSEGGSYSLLLRITENCQWNKCAFCEMYKEHSFVYRNPEEIKKDIDAVKVISDEIKAVSEKIGFGDRILQDAAVAIINADHSLYYNQCFITVYNWLYSGGKTAFLQDADSMIMRPHEYIEVLQYLREKLNTLTRVTSYARSKTLAHRKLEELKAIKAAGLDRVHVGLETGDDEILKLICKGTTSTQEIEGGKKVIEAGLQLSEYWMTDLGGRERWRQHAENTARVLSEINPHYIRSRPFIPRPGTPLFHEYQQCKIHISSPHQRLEELRLTIEGLNVTSKVCFDHRMNSWVNEQGSMLFSNDYEGYKFPEEKQLVLDLISEGLSINESKHVDARDLISMNSL